MKRSAHSKAVLDDSWITPLTLLFSLSHSESEQYKLLDSKSRSGLGKEEVCVWPPTKLEKIINPVQNKNDTRPISMQLINWENFQLNCHIQLNI